MAVSDIGTVFTWGRANKHRLGYGEANRSDQLVPKMVEMLVGLRVVKVTCGHSHTMVVTGKTSANVDTN